MIRRLIEKISSKIYLYIPWLFYKTYRHDTNLPDSINKKNCLPASELNTHILLIGPTGYLGPYLLHSLQQKNPSATIYCLFRNHDDYTYPIDYIKNHFQQLGLSEHIDWNRVQCIVGDIASPRLGLSDQDYDFVCQKIDSIFHIAAWTNHMRPYTWIHSSKKHDLRETNTLSVLEALKISSTHKIKPIHFTSTLWACCKLSRNHTLAETLPQHAKDKQFTNWLGYMLSKTAAEILLAKAIKRGLPCTVYRFGQLTGALYTLPCVANNNHLSLELKGCIELGYSHKKNIVRSFLPSDIAANLMADIALSHNRTSDVYNFFPPSFATWKELMNGLKKKGYDIKSCSYKTWVKKLCASGERNSLYPFLSEYKHSHFANFIAPVIDYVDKGKIENKAFTDALNQYGYTCPSTMDLLNRYIDEFIRTGFFPSPSDNTDVHKK